MTSSEQRLPIWCAFTPSELTADELRLQSEVRAFLADRLPRGSFEPGLGSFTSADPQFSKELAARGWLGMALPVEFGGRDRSAVERFVVTEELLRWGAPITHHWVAERQSAPIILRYGTDVLRRKFLPRICAGELAFCIGMSEPDAGSDLAAVRTSAAKTDGGWLLNGAKIWTTGAHRADWIIVLCRTSEESDRHRGLSQLLVDLRGDGVSIRPIPFIDGRGDFDEVHFLDVFVPDEMVLGAVGNGWSQVGSELAFERGGAERWLSTYLLVEQFLRESESLSDEATRMVGGLVARWWVVRQLSLSVARSIDTGKAPARQAALVKEVGTRFEQDVVAILQGVVEAGPCEASRSLFARLLAKATLVAPACTIRGGTTEILLSVISRGLTDV